MLDNVSKEDCTSAGLKKINLFGHSGGATFQSAGNVVAGLI